MGLPAEAEGYRLELSSNASSGYKGVYLNETSGQFMAVVTKSSDAAAKYVGVFPSALEAATARAKFLVQQEAQRKQEAGALTMLYEGKRQEAALTAVVYGAECQGLRTLNRF